MQQFVLSTAYTLSPQKQEKQSRIVRSLRRFQYKLSQILYGQDRSLSQQKGWKMKFTVTALCFLVMNFRVLGEGLPSVNESLNFITIGLKIPAFTVFCHLKSTELSVTTPKRRPYEDKFQTRGTISVRFGDLRRKCKTAQTNLGKLSFGRGQIYQDPGWSLQYCCQQSRVIRSSSQLGHEHEEAPATFGQ